MSFRWCLPEERKDEEALLFALAARVSLRKAGVERDRASFEKYILPLFESKEVHAGVTDNAIAFALLGEILRPDFGDGHLLPQNSPHWLTFRRLFLALYEEEVPARLLAESSGSPWDGMSDLEKAELAQTLGLEDSAANSTPDADLETDLPQTFESASLEEHYATQVPIIRPITETRLASYEAVNITTAKESLIEEGQIDLDPACGALYEISQNIAWDHVPTSTDLPRSKDEPTTTSLLADAVNEAGIDFDIEAEYRESARSVRAVLFDIATEMTVGKVVDPSIDIAELEDLFLTRRVVEDPYTLLSDERIQNHFADGMGMEGPDFLRRIASMFETAEEKGVRVRLNPVKTALAAHWIDPQFPLWLMRMPAVENFLKILGIDNDEYGYGLGETIREFTKARSGSPKSPLDAASKRLITSLELQSPLQSYQRMTFPKYLEAAPSFHALQEHTINLSISDLER